mmetsp:Transcript_48405/g.94602  ORF Transcript_48405/g.94602 Transcript_48405/m.94602 type:complete len:92 (+) Transcript_48405:181-456(+)
MYDLMKRLFLYKYWYFHGKYQCTSNFEISLTAVCELSLFFPDFLFWWLVSFYIGIKTAVLFFKMQAFQPFNIGGHFTVQGLWIAQRVLNRF